MHLRARAMQSTLYQNETHHRIPQSQEYSELLRAIVRRSAPDGRIRGLAEKIRDWDELLRRSKDHRVLPLLFARLTEAGAAVPPEAHKRLHAEYQRNVFHCMANTVELIALLKAFDEQEIPAMPFKGVVLAASVYGDLSARAAGDLDLLVHFRDLQRAAALLLDKGYELETAVHADLSPAIPDYYEYHFERRSDGMVVELRWKMELVTPRLRRGLGIDWVWPRRRTALLAGAKVPGLDPETTLLMLCLHGSKHVWTRLAWIVDVARLLASSPDLDWKEIDREARQTGLWRTLALGVLLAHRIAGANVPSAVLRKFESNGTVSRLAQHIDANLFDAPGRIPPGFVPYSIRLLGFRDRIGLLLSLDLFKPNERDRAAARLPRRLPALYYLIRPLRILLDRSPR